MATPSKPTLDGTASSEHHEQYSLFLNQTDEVAELVSSSPPTGRFSNFVVYVDESGDHGLQTVDRKR